MPKFCPLANAETNCTDNCIACLDEEDYLHLDYGKNYTTPTLWVYKTVHGTVNVAIQNCDKEVATLLWRFDIWKSKGRHEFNDDKPLERAKIWFECPIEFVDFVGSSMGRACFQRMGVESFNFEL